ncbi:DivIVA domain-containing protein [Thermomonospora umbrina]|uniref:Cell wall synthesis protein Wag31 n=1 Tax=Thermomonospora umbrina TaxID=111806 RepID=A0A3D9SQR4_9ACTN|nr:DivIVA domain-containing protein [Thermomonospora umbrina]REE94934.1 DivIVA domain-containing protein [Thermomonospora umbrina]
MNGFRLTPDAVRGKRFSTTRLRPGYDEGEVDDFLDLVESEVSLLIRERGDARARLEALRRLLPRHQDLDDLAANVAALYRVLWDEPHPEASGMTVNGGPS